MMLSKSLFVANAKTCCRLTRANSVYISTRRWSSDRKISILSTRESRQPSSTWRWLSIAGVGLGLSASVFSSPILCESIKPEIRPASPTATTADEGMEVPENDKAHPLPPPPTSAVNLYELSFGTVAGVCAGVFVKKGAKAVAFFVGGVFVLLQYFNSLSLIKIDWGRAASKFENFLYTTGNDGVKHPPSVSSLWQWLVDFLTADFQPRASFLAGLALGLRIG